MLERGKTLEENLRKLEEERQRSEQLLHRMMPKAVADRLRDGQKAIDTCEVQSVVLFFRVWVRNLISGTDRKIKK